jgi:acyl carrier protein
VNADAAPSTRAEMLDVLRFELHEVNPEIPRDLPDDKELIAELGIDSLDVVEFVARLEYRFRFVVQTDEWQELATLDAIAAYGLRRLER